MLMSKKVDAIARILLSETPADYDLAMDELQQLMTQSEDILPDRITLKIHNLLAELGFNTRQTGHIFLAEAIKITVADPMATLGMTCPNGLLEQVGAKFCRTADTAERAMRKSIEWAWNHGSQEVQNKYYTIISPNTFAPTLSYFITRSASLVRQQLPQE